MNYLKISTLSCILATILTTLLLNSSVSKATPLSCSWSVVGSPSPGTTSNGLNAVAAVSANDVWAAGNYNSSILQTLIEHWSGSSWTIVPSPSPGTISSNLGGVAAISTSNVWAVGDYNSSNGHQTLIEHWNGTQWKIVSSPNIAGTDNILSKVSATSAHNVWAIGYYLNDTGRPRTLIEHWNGIGWSIVPSPNPGTSDNVLYGVTAISASNVWAVGFYDDIDSGFAQTLIEHWDGTGWSVVPSPNPGGSNKNNFLSSVAAISATNIWAVGYYGPTIIEHWDGTSWSVVPSPSPGPNTNFLIGVAAVSSTKVWTVGVYLNSNGIYKTLTERWNGTSWNVVSSSSPSSTYSALASVARLPATSQVWAVGNYKNASDIRQTLTEFHC